MSVIGRNDKIMDTKILMQALERQIPKEILENFELVGVTERSADEVLYDLEEKEERQPEVGKELVKNGHMRSVEIQHYPIGEQRTVLRLKRRRWTDKETKSETYFNTYQYTEPQCKITRQLAAFLKDAGIEVPF